MKKLFCQIICCLFFPIFTHAQESLPSITVNSFNGKVIVSWLNDYDKPITDIFIQRSYDSSRNFTTIGSVLIPQNKENGFPDNNPPYDHMYYRVSITFQGGSYVIGPAVKPERVFNAMFDGDIRDTSVKKSISMIYGLNFSIRDKVQDSTDKQNTVKPKEPIKIPVENNINNTSNLVFFNRYNQINIQMPPVPEKKYQIKFYDESEKMIFELNQLSHDLMMLEKYNFRKAGNYRFEIYEDGKLWRKNSIFISKDYKSGNK